jgi:hypothetical protein
MTDATAEIAELRETVEQRERELEAAVRDLKAAAKRVIGPTEWFREHPLPFLAGAVLVGWWLGSRGRERRRR